MKITRRDFNSIAAAAALGSALPGPGGRATADSAAADSQTTDASHWNLLMITNDQHRGDCLGCMGNPVVQTPNVDRLASEGVLFEQYYVQCPQCVPSRSAMYTGRYPHVNLTPSNLYRLSEQENTLATVLNANGYTTACVGELPFAPTKYLAGIKQVVASGREHDAFLASQGWAGSRISEERRKQIQQREADAKVHFQAAADPWPAELDETAFWAGKAKEFLTSNRDRNFFLHVNFRRPHHPFDPPQGYDRMYADATFPASMKRDGEMANKPPQQQKAIANSVGFDLNKLSDAELHRVKSYYYGMISLNDHYIGEILGHLKSLGLAEKTIVVFNADHGEMLGDHGLLFKGAYFYDGVEHVALAIRMPGKIRPGLRVKDLVEEVDLLPTLLSLLGIAPPGGVQGVSLAPYFSGGSVRKDAVYAEFPNIKMVRTKDWKLVHYLNAQYGELYDLRDDPHELTNLHADRKAAGARAQMEHMLADWLIRSQDPLRQPITAEQS
jgi:arylsulfatase A-like enzyme